MPPRLWEPHGMPVPLAGAAPARLALATATSVRFAPALAAPGVVLRAGGGCTGATCVRYIPVGTTWAAGATGA